MPLRPPSSPVLQILLRFDTSPPPLRPPPEMRDSPRVQGRPSRPQPAPLSQPNLHSSVTPSSAVIPLTFPQPTRTSMLQLALDTPHLHSIPIIPPPREGE